MIDVGSEALLTFSEAACELPCRRQGKKVSVTTVWRWARRGSRGIRLETLATPGGLVTSREAIGRFFQALTEFRQASSGSNPSSSGLAPLAGRRSPSRRQRESETAEKWLIERGA